MTTDEKLEKIWEQQGVDARGIRHPVQYERCGHANGWRLYIEKFDELTKKPSAGGPDAIVTEGSPSLREAVDAAYAKLFPAETTQL